LSLIFNGGDSSFGSPINRGGGGGFVKFNNFVNGFGIDVEVQVHGFEFSSGQIGELIDGFVVRSVFVLLVGLDGFEIGVINSESVGFFLGSSVNFSVGIFPVDERVIDVGGDFIVTLDGFLVVHHVDGNSE